MFRVTNVAEDRDLTPCSAAAPVVDEGEEHGGAAISIEDIFESHDGADTRYVGVANKRAFSALHVAFPVTRSPSQHGGQMLSPSLCPRDTLATPASRSIAAASSTTTTATLSQQLTPVHRPSLGRSPQQHTPHHHSTSYDHDRYQRFLTNALLSESEAGRPSSVLSFPMRTPTRVNRASRRETPDACVMAAAAQCRTGSLDHAAVPHNTVHEEPQSTASILHSSVVSGGWATELMSEGARSAVVQSEEKGHRRDGIPVDAYLWQPTKKAPRNVSRVDDAAEPESTLYSAAHLPSAGAPFAYFQRAPPVWSRPAQTSLRLPSTRDEDNSTREADEACGTAILGFAAAQEGDELGSLRAVQRAQCTGAGVDVAVASVCPNTPFSPHGDPAVTVGAAAASFFTPRHSPGVLSAAGELDRPDGVTTPLRLPSSTAQHVISDTPLPFVSARRSLTLPILRYISEDDTDDEEGEKTAAPLLSTPVDCVIEASCATPVASSAAGSPTLAWPLSSGLGRTRVANGAASVRSHAVHRRSPARSVLSSLATSRQLTTPQRLFTPVHHTDNSIRGASATGPSAAASSDALMTSSSIRGRAVSPAETMLSTTLSTARHRDGTGVQNSRTHSQPQQPQRHSRNTFHFIRALTAGEVSTDMRHRPLYWGCFGILVAQPTEVWCVGQTHPFRLFPPEHAPSVWMPRNGELEVTTVATTERLSLAQWEAASIAAGTPEASPPVVVYAAIGSSAGDVFVYGYSKCPPTAPDATPVTLDTAQVHAHSTHTVRLTQQGVLQRADRLGGSDGVSEAKTRAATAHGSPSMHDSTVSVVRVIDHWLYVGDQSGYVSRYDLRHTNFLCAVSTDTASSSALTATAAEPQGTREAKPCRESSARSDPTMAPLPARLNPCMPVHHFGRPLLLAGASPTARSSTPSQSAPAASTPAPKFHYAVNVGEPVYHLEVTSSQSYLAVGTQTRLLVYRTAQLPRISDTSSSASPSPPLPFHAPFIGTSAGTPSREGSSGNVNIVHERGDGATPLVVVSDAAQPVRCFAWMFCDYESLMQSLHARSPVEKQVFFSDTDDDDSEAFSPVPLTSDDEIGIGNASSKFVALGSACRRHTPTPSLVFATVWQESTEVAEGQSPRLPVPRVKTDIRVFRVVTQTTVTSCTLGYPVHVLAVLPGTTQIIVGTGGAVELERPASPGASSPAGHPLPASPQVPADLLTGLQLSSPFTSPVLRFTSVTTATATSVSPLGGFRPPAIVGRRPSLAVAAAEALWNRPYTVRHTARSVHPTGAGAVHQQQQQHRAHTSETNGYLFLLEVCPADSLAVGSGAGYDCRVCLRVRGEVGVGEGESAVCGAMNPLQDHVSVLIHPTESDPRVVASPPRDGSRAKVKVWRISTDVQSACIISTPGGLLFPSESQQQMECLR
ncbi:conserved hypothetical protein [Leishmania major strain Friedlin]|uniref:Uncharacterized protein L8530.07 n=1 Tax=Leishmania major TaxID=5664 RepID=Q9GRM9_LEIMA|nr:conserved hypothetical protein [Leishmania major strain Friedlin]CAC14610.1 hypothetical protein L8530.07 [Leishmania major]CAG9580818.1 hypothetical_protein_-_conserved [Leishmania major strain Friedlin]CAJ06580.1 conserved hypothetical protein [Leishmania major strain Friedlin]|eukprot:XP_001685979.1 conserved hypothetical protein [Leishmania major strain Friedlin]